MSLPFMLPLGAMTQAFYDADASRYFAAGSLVMLLYDHCLTSYDEYRYVWKAPPSFAKYGLLLNRYLVLAMLVVMNIEMCGFNGVTFSDTACQRFLVASAMVSVLSVALGNMLLLLRVLVLWQEDKRMKIFLCSTYVASICVTFSTMLLSCVKLSPLIQWSPYVEMCIITGRPAILGAVWGAPLFFEISVIISVIYNAMSTPRSSHVRLTQALRKDGVSFFLSVTMLRLLNLIAAVVARPGLTLVATNFVWASITVLLNRSLLRLRKLDIKEQENQIPLNRRAASPFGILPQHHMKGYDESETEDDQIGVESFTLPPFRDFKLTKWNDDW